MSEEPTPRPSLYERILAPFSRVTSSGRYVPEIDGLRCLAIVLVILFHAHWLYCDGSEASTFTQALQDPLTQTGNWIIGKGWFGVQIFFIISGLVLALPFASHHLYEGRKPDTKNYFLRRLVRIEVPYLLTLSFFFFGGAYLFGSSLSENFIPYLQGLIYSYGILNEGGLNPILTVSWTLEIEIQFYLLAPLLCRVFTLKNATFRRGLLLLATLASGEFTGWANAILPSEAWGHTLIGQFGYFFVGLLLADLYLAYRQNPSEKHPITWDLVGLVAWPAAFILLDHPTPIELKPLVLALGFWAVLCGRYLKRLFSLRWVTAIGTMCYTIYLFHSFVLYGIFCHYLINPYDLITKGTWPINYLWMALLTLGIVAVCALIFLVVEKPFARGKLPSFRKPKALPQPEAERSDNKQPEPARETEPVS